MILAAESDFHTRSLITSWIFCLEGNFFQLQIENQKNIFWKQWMLVKVFVISNVI